MPWPKGRPQSAEHIAARAASRKPRTLDTEARAAISARMRGHLVSAETRRAIAAKLRGRRLSPEHRAKVIQTLRPNPRGMLGKHHTPETRARIAAANLGNTSARNAPVKGECVYCGGLATEYDHVVPVSRGGPDTSGNRVLSCRPCNASKGQQTPEEWMLGG